MKWTPEQDGALRAVSEWFKHRSAPSFYLAGYAGTGKTTLARHFAENVSGVTKFAAFTGKAASVLRKRGCYGATTIHSLIYRPIGQTNAKQQRELEMLIEAEENKDKDDRSPNLAKWRRELADLAERSRAMFELRKEEESEITEADLVIIDECSMIDQKMGRDLERFGVPILYLGDPGQLPPVNGKGLLVGSQPDYVLQEIHRQAAESPIIWLAHQIRQGEHARFGSFGDGEVQILRKAEFDWERVLVADQIICGKNQTRYRLNKGARQRLGFQKLYPLQGDKLICLKNDHDEGLLNGVTCESLHNTVKKGNLLEAQILYEGKAMMHYIDPGHFELNYHRRLSYPPYDTVQHFDYGYAITGHKSQGSQWRDVVVCDDKMKADDIAHRRKWLYTVVTRAEEVLTVYA